MNKDKMTSPPDSTDPVTEAVLDLKAVRESKGISLRDIFLATRITMVNLAAIEEGQFHLLPEPVYARTFIKAYTKFLDIDPRPLLDHYEQYVSSLEGPPATKEDPDKNPGREVKTGKKRHILLWTAAVFVIVVSLLYLISPQDSNILQLLDLQTTKPEKPALVIPPKATPSLPENLPVPSSPPDTHTTPAGGEAPQASTPMDLPAKTEGMPVTGPRIQSGAAVPGPGATPEGRYRLVITGFEKTWVRIREDDTRTHEMILYRGDVVERFASDTFVVDIGNAGGIDISFQGKSLGRIGERGQVVHLRLP